MKNNIIESLLLLGVIAIGLLMLNINVHTETTIKNGVVYFSNAMEIMVAYLLLLMFGAFLIWKMYDNDKQTQ